MNNNFFKFEKKNIDFPIYNKKINKLDFFLISISILFFLMPSLVPLMDYYFFKFLFYSFPITTILITSKLKLSLFLKKITKKDIFLIFKLFISSLIFSLFIGFIFLNLNLIPNELSIDIHLGLSISQILNIIYVAILIFYEELLKFFIFILTLTLSYKFINNRKKSILIACFITMVLFGVCHCHSYNLGTIVFSILAKGFGSIFEIYAYLKTKNILVSYIIHFLFDFSTFILQSI